MNPVSMLIFNALAQRRGINLPGIGSLQVISEPARMQDNGNLIPPFSRVIYSADLVEGYDEILRLIGESSGRDEAGSREIYETWFAEVYAEDGVHIDSIGEIIEGQFRPTEELQHTLNPSGVAVVPLQRPFTMRQIFFWVAATVVVGGGLAAGLITYLNSRPAPYDAPYAEGTPFTETLAPNDSSLQASTTGNDTEKSLTALTEIDLATQATAETPTVSSSQPTPGSTTTPTNATGLKPGSAPAPANDNKPSTAQTSPNAGSTPTETTPRRGEMRYYVVVGTYSTDENAERFIASARKKDASQNYRKLLLSNGKIMVYTADMASDAEAQQQRRSLNETFPDAWVFKRRAR